MYAVIYTLYWLSCNIGNRNTLLYNLKFFVRVKLYRESLKFSQPKPPILFINIFYRFFFVLKLKTAISIRLSKLITLGAFFTLCLYNYLYLKFNIFTSTKYDILYFLQKFIVHSWLCKN